MKSVVHPASACSCTPEKMAARVQTTHVLEASHLPARKILKKGTQSRMQELFQCHQPAPSHSSWALICTYNRLQEGAQVSQELPRCVLRLLRTASIFNECFCRDTRDTLHTHWPVVLALYHRSHAIQEIQT